MIRKLFKNLFGADNASEPSTPAKPVRPRPVNRGTQVFSGAVVEPPAFVGLSDPANLTKACQEHAVCEYAPKIEFQRLYHTGRRTAEGNLEIAYEGISVSCSGIKTFGLPIAREDSLSQAYRYADLNHIYACCCGDPKKCRFHQEAKAEDDQVTRRQRSPGEFEPKPGEEKAE